MTSNNLLVRTFCHNPKGYIVSEKYDIDDKKIITVNGHSFNNKKSNNTNIALLVTHKFTEPFNDPTTYGKNIAQLSNLLAGQGKIICQRLKDYRNRKRSKYIYRRIPAIQQHKYTLGDLSYVLPSKTYDAIRQFIDEVSKVVPQFGDGDNLLYGVEVKFYGQKTRDQYDMRFIGDCSGKTRSIIGAASAGYMLAKEQMETLNVYICPMAKVQNKKKEKK